MEAGIWIGTINVSATAVSTPESAIAAAAAGLRRITSLENSVASAATTNTWQMHQAKETIRWLIALAPSRFAPASRALWPSAVFAPGAEPTAPRASHGRPARRVLAPDSAKRREMPVSVDIGRGDRRGFVREIPYRRESARGL